jgi:uncharacterized protein (DUF58 family)
MTAISIDWTSVRAAAASFRIAMPRSPARGSFGERLGTNAGSSLEFQDYRQYAAGDDLRHVDWAAYARSEILTVRLYREEVAPRIDIVVDTSLSMAVTSGKAQAYGELVGLLACAAQTTAADARVITGAAPEAVRLQRAEDFDRFLDCSMAISAIERLPLPLRRQSVRIVVSDFLFPHDPDALIAHLGRDAAALALVQLTTSEESDPAPAGAFRFVDVEGNGELDLLLDANTVDEYRDRFNRLRRGLDRASRRAAARFAHVTAGTALREVARTLVAAGVIDAV